MKLWVDKKMSPINSIKGRKNLASYINDFKIEEKYPIQVIEKRGRKRRRVWRGIYPRWWVVFEVFHHHIHEDKHKKITWILDYSTEVKIKFFEFDFDLIFLKWFINFLKVNTDLWKRYSLGVKCKSKSMNGDRQLFTIAHHWKAFIE